MLSASEGQGKAADSAYIELGKMDNVDREDLKDLVKFGTPTTISASSARVIGKRLSLGLERSVTA